MHRSYNDIRSRIAEHPSWWQEGGVPRYGTFDPEVAGSVYANEIALVEIACQLCRTPFLATIETSRRDGRIAQGIRDRSLSYGDPPNVDCCGAGAATSSLTCRVVQYWARGHEEFVNKDRVVTDLQFFEWRRDPSLELVFPS
jgi:hypothetical protein